MRSIRHATLALSIALALLGAVVAHAAPEAARGGHDVGSLMTAAREHYDLSRLDAVLLLEHSTIELRQDGTRATTVHRIVWFGTEMGLDAYADLRVAHNTETSTLEVHALRTWRDGRWWPDASEVSETAVVTTTPYALASAYDYSTIRETMLLHDGVELPCIVETVYTITERRGAGLGSDGLWVLPKADPAVLTELTIMTPAGAGFSHASGNGAPAPELTSADGNDRRTWSARLVDRLPRPLVTAPERHAPYVAWSTWDSWDDLGDAFSSEVEATAGLDDALADSVASVTEDRPFAFARAAAVAEFIGTTTRAIHYDGSFWEFAPRTATRTWDTAYGHGLDRTVLATALFREAGLTAVPVFAGRGRGAVDADVPTLARFDGPFLSLTGEGVSAVYDASTNTLHQGPGMLQGRAVWTPGGGNAPASPSRTGESATFDLVVSLTRDGEGIWTGTGLLSTTGTLSVYDDVVGLDGESGDYLSRVASAAVAGASLEDHSLSLLTSEAVTAGFSFSFEAPEPDDGDRTRLVPGDPPGGVMSALPADVHLYVGERDSHVALPSAMRQSVAVTVKGDDVEAVRIPEEVALENATGSFRLSVDEGDDGSFTVTRELSINGSGSPSGTSPVTVAPAEWPALRALLLEEADPRNRTIMLK
ncbi:MAG: DUF3857 domain-containing protein [Candidatus Eisenbacteria bacterium]